MLALLGDLRQHLTHLALTHIPELIPRMVCHVAHLDAPAVGYPVYYQIWRTHHDPLSRQPYKPLDIVNTLIQPLYAVGSKDHNLAPLRR